MRPEGLCQRKIPMTTLGIELATFRLVSHCFIFCVFGNPESYFCQDSTFSSDADTRISEGVNNNNNLFILVQFMQYLGCFPINTGL
jgi:hypothetical protein